MTANKATPEELVQKLRKMGGLTTSCSMGTATTVARPLNYRESFEAMALCREAADLIESLVQKKGDTSVPVDAPAEPAAWRVRIGDSNIWGYCETEEDADFHGKASGCKYLKEPLFIREESATGTSAAITLPTNKPDAH